MLADLVIRGGTVCDGSGGDSFEADIAIADGRIVGIGDGFDGAEEIDARGKLVTPGFVDIHTHYDGQVTWENRLSPSSQHGATTVVMGNCAIGFAPVRPEHRELLLSVIEGVEDIPEAVMAAGVPWSWESFPEYLDFLETRHADADFAAQVPHGAVRVYVMGERGADREPPTAEELNEMTRLVAEGIEAGALGVSTSHSIAHRTSAGALAPTETSGEAEMMALARGVREAGRGVLELIIDFDDVALGGTAEFDLLKRMADTGQCPLTFGLVEIPAHPDSWRSVLDMAEEANRNGYRLYGQIAPRPVGMLFGLDVSYNPFTFRDSYREIAHLPLEERVHLLRDPERRQRILSEEPHHKNTLMVYLTSRFDDMFPMGDIPSYEPPAEASLGSLAAQQGVSPAELAYDFMLEKDGKAMFWLPAVNFCDGTLSSVEEMIESDATIVALGDGGAHYGLICDASYPTFVLSYWGRDRDGRRFELPRLVHELTHKPAQIVGLQDRGLLKVGYKADLNVIDMGKLALHAPDVRQDLPGGGKRIFQRATGYDATIVSGVVTYRDGEATGALPGRLVRSGAMMANREAQSALVH